MPTQTAAASLLSRELTEYLQGPQLVMVTTLDAETKWPTNNLITWVLARDERTLRLVADAEGRVLQNIRDDARVVLTVMTPGACHAIEGRGAVVAERLDAVSIKAGMAEIRVETVRDVTFYGGRVTEPPRYEVTFDQQMKEKLDREVFDAMRRP